MTTSITIPRTELDTCIDELCSQFLRIRHDLHRCPELGFQEHRTAARVAEILAAHGLAVTTGVGGTGVVGLLCGSLPGPTLAIRACLDALPVTEQTGLPFASENPGVMHACGHDGNMAYALGAAMVLARLQPHLAGQVKFIFQPAEEDTGGAAAIIQAGALTEPMVDAMVTLHNWPGLPQGQLAVRPGRVMAASDLFRITIQGTPGHGAWPHLAVDPVVAAAELILRLQQVVSREIDPLRPAVISIGQVQGGTAANIIPGEVTLEGTVRTLDDQVRDFVQERIETIVRSVALAARAGYELQYRRVMPPVNNDPGLAAWAEEILREALGPAGYTTGFTPVMGCEEFSLFQERLPGLFLYMGNDRKDSDLIPLHSPSYEFNDATLPAGVKALCALALGVTRLGG